MLGRLHEAMKGGSRPVQAGLVEEGLFYFFYFTIYIYIPDRRGTGGRHIYIDRAVI